LKRFNADSSSARVFAQFSSLIHEELSISHIYDSVKLQPYEQPMCVHTI